MKTGKGWKVLTGEANVQFANWSVPPLFMSESAPPSPGSTLPPPPSLLTTPLAPFAPAPSLLPASPFSPAPPRASLGPFLSKAPPVGGGPHRAPPALSAQTNGGGRGLLSTSSYGKFHPVKGRGSYSQNCNISALLSPKPSPPNIPGWECWGQSWGVCGWGETVNCGVSPDSFANFGGLLAPPTQFSLLSYWHKVNIPGWASETLPPPHHPAPWGGVRGLHNTNHTF